MEGSVLPHILCACVCFTVLASLSSPSFDLAFFNYFGNNYVTLVWSQLSNIHKGRIKQMFYPRVCNLFHGWWNITVYVMVIQPLHVVQITKKNTKATHIQREESDWKPKKSWPFPSMLPKDVPSWGRWNFEFQNLQAVPRKFSPG